jgi:hypothetical protein
VAITGGVHEGTVVVALRSGAAPLVPEGDFRVSTDAKICAYKLDAAGEAEFLAAVDATMAQLQGSNLAFDMARPGTGVQRMEDGSPTLHVAAAPGKVAAAVPGQSALAP